MTSVPQSSVPHEHGCTLRLPLKSVLVAGLLWLGGVSMGVMMLGRILTGGGQQGGRSNGNGYLLPFIVVGLAAGLVMALLSAWRTRVTIDLLGITRRGMFRTRYIPSEAIQAIDIAAARGDKLCVVKLLGSSMSLNLSLCDQATGRTLTEALLENMPDKVTSEFRRHAAILRMSRSETPASPSNK